MDATDPIRRVSVASTGQADPPRPQGVDLAVGLVVAACLPGEIHRFYAPELGWPPEVAVRGTGR